MSARTAAKTPFPYLSLLWEMTRGEIRMRDQGTMLGFLWTLLHPALMFVVLYGLFSKWVGRFVPQYMSYLLIGIVLWNFFQKATSYALGSLRRVRGTILNYRFPREIAVFASIAAVSWSSLMDIVVLMFVVLLLGQPPRWTWLLLPAVIGLELLMVTGIGLFLSVWGTEYQDLERIWDVLTSSLFYLTPVFYSLDMLHPRQQALLRFNPLVWILGACRGCLIAGSLPEPAPMLALLAGGLVLVAGGVALLRRREFVLADKLLF